MAQSTAGRSVREANGPARSEPVQVRVQPVPMFRPRDRRWLAAVVVAAVLPYLDSLQGAFVFDDFGLVTQNPYAAPAMPLLAWFTRPSTSGSLYRPLTMVSYGLNALLSPNPLSYHLMNVALHALAALAAFSLARSLLRSTPAAGVAALLFAVHPVHTEPVANIAGRAEVLAGLFSLLALACFARATDAAAGKRLWSVASLAAFAAGLLSKGKRLCDHRARRLGLDVDRARPPAHRRSPCPPVCRSRRRVRRPSMARRWCDHARRAATLHRQSPGPRRSFGASRHRPRGPG